MSSLWILVCLLVVSFKSLNVESVELLNVEEGRPFHLTCTVRGKPRTADLVWTFQSSEGGRVRQIAKECSYVAPSRTIRLMGISNMICSREVYTLKFKSVTINSAGTYVCTVRGRGKTMRVVVNKATFPISVVIEPSEHLKEDDDAVITCHTPGRPPGKNLKWYHTAKGSQQRHLIAENWKSIRSKSEKLGISTAGCQGTKKCYLKFKHVIRATNGQFTCAVDGKESSATINVDDADINLRVEITPRATLVEGERAELTCYSDGRPRSEQLYWYYQADASSRRNKIAMNWKSDRSRTIRLGVWKTGCKGRIKCYIMWRSVTVGSSGIYTCKVGTKEASVRLQVEEAEITFSR